MLQHQQHIHMHRTPIQSHDHPSQQRPNSLPQRRGGAGAGGGGTEHQSHPGHVIQYRTASHAHVLKKRSRSKGRRQPPPQQQQQGYASSGAGRRTTSSHQEANFEDSMASFASSMGNMSFASGMHNHNSSDMMIHDGKMNEFGRCSRHPNIELCCRDSPNSPWRVLLQDCPLCSMDVNTGLAQLRPDMAGNKMHDCGSSSQATPTPSMKTNRTLTTEEESSVKSWTMSDASDSENDSGGGRTSASVTTAEPLFNPRVPPRPPPKPPNKFGANAHSPQAENPSYSQQQPQMQSQSNIRQLNNDPISFDPLQSLKELGRKLVIESEKQQEQNQQQQKSAFEGSVSDMSMGMRSQASSAKRRFPPPPPTRPPARNARAPPPPRRSGGNSVASAMVARVLEKAGTGVNDGGGALENDSNETVLGEASDIIARMENLTSEGEAGFSVASRRGSQRQQQQPTNAAASEDDAIAKAAEEKRARAQRRQERAERKAERNRTREMRQQLEQERQQKQQQRHEDGGTYEMPMKESSRGREARTSTDDILQAAAKIRARARRSTSRSRERVKEASIFCGETPVDYNTDDDHVSVASKRSILNPHGLENQPSPPSVERRSQSRERRRSSSKGRGNKTPGKERGSRGGSHGRNRSRTGSGDMLHGEQQQQQQPTTKDLLERRREMRQKIAERQQANQSRIDHRSLKEEVLEGWSRGGSGAKDSRSARGSRSRKSTDERSHKTEERTRRSRSRSRVRDGISKIRSSSLFSRKKGEKQHASSGDMWSAEMETETIDTGKRSTSSFKRFLSRGKSRSDSRDRRSSSRGRGGEQDGWAAKSESFLEENDHDQKNLRQSGNFDARSMSGKSARSERSGSLSLGMFKKSSRNNSKKRQQSKGGGMVRSLSRGNFRRINSEADFRGEDENSHDMDHGNYDDGSYSWEDGSNPRGF